MAAVLAFNRDIKTNSQLIEQVAQLNHLTKTMVTFDATWGLGNFWTLWKPDTLFGGDIEPGKARDIQTSFLNLPFRDATFDAVVFDAPYKLNGTERFYVNSDMYGVAASTNWKTRMQRLRDGTVECARVVKPGGVLLVKCQDQVVNNRKVWQTKQVAELLSGQARLVDELYLWSYRPQPVGRAQRHARTVFSVLQVYRIGEKWDGDSVKQL